MNYSSTILAGAFLPRFPPFFFIHSFIDFHTLRHTKLYIVHTKSCILIAYDYVTCYQYHTLCNLFYLWYMISFNIFSIICLEEIGNALVNAIELCVLFTAEVHWCFSYQMRHLELCRISCIQLMEKPSHADSCVCYTNKTPCCILMAHF